jgi:hypothetical protein
METTIPIAIEVVALGVHLGSAYGMPISSLIERYNSFLVVVKVVSLLGFELSLLGNLLPT